ncbi:MAG: hypothetical protein WC965_00785 [Thiohalomonadaceae bacterium]
MQPINLSIPIRNKPGTDSFATSPEAVRIWLDKLPLGHTGQTARQMYLALHEVNRLETSFQHRLNFLEQLSEPMQGVLNALKPHYHGKPFPLTPKVAQVVQLALELRAAMVIGYQIVMQQSDGKFWLSQRKWEQVWTKALHRMLHYLNGIANLHNQIHRPLPAGFWLTIHNAYRLLEDNDLLDAEIPSLSDAKPITLGYAYKQLLLLSLLPQQRMQAAQLDEVRRHMQQWTDALQLIKPANVTACSEAWCIDLDEDQAPGPLWKLLNGRSPNIHSLRLLQMTTLLDQINKQLSKQHISSNSITLPDGASLSRPLATMLMTAWQGPPHRNDERKSARGVAHIVLGLNEIHALLAGVTTEAEDKTEDKTEITATAESTDTAQQKESDLEIIGLQDKKQSFAHSIGFAGDRDEDADVWDMVYTAKTSTQTKSWADIKVSKTYTLLQSELIDHSRGGLGLQLPAGHQGSVRAGELIAFSTAETASEWNLGMVRWLQTTAKNEIKLGIKRLQEHVIPASIRIEHKGQHSAPIDCLLGHEQDQLRIVLPHMISLRNKHLLLTLAAREVAISLFELLESSPVFQMYRCTENQARKEEEEKPTTNPDDPYDKFKNMWEIL